MQETLTEQSIKKNKTNRECATYLRNNPLQEKTENAQHTNVTIHYMRKLRMRETLT